MSASLSQTVRVFTKKVMFFLNKYGISPDCLKKYIHYVNISTISVIKIQINMIQNTYLSIKI